MHIKSAPFGISVIICTHNGAERLIPTLEALERQDVPVGLPWEILIIDNGSTDDTLSITDSFRKNFKKDIILRILSEPVLGKSNALVKGYDEAKYELMLVCDDDNWLQPQYLKTVAEIYREHPQIGLLGGYGIPEFRSEHKPVWFEKYKQAYACGKHHNKNGFLAKSDASIWGAGSVIRKTLWSFLRENGFHFINNTVPGAALGEDVELSHAVMFSGCKLYFDDRLWFYHDLSKRRITKKNLKKQIKNSGCTLFVIYDIAYKNSPGLKHRFNSVFFRWLLFHIYYLFILLLKKNNVLLRRHIFTQLKELATQKQKLKTIYDEIFPWISKVKESFPLKGTSL